LQTRERLLVGRRFLLLRPKIAALVALDNGACLVASGASALQKLVVGATLSGTVVAFFIEAWWLERGVLSERWLLSSLTLLCLTIGAGLSGGLQSPFLPLLFAPVVVGFAAFARARRSAFLFCVTAGALACLALATPSGAFGVLPAPWATRMLLVSAVGSLALLAAGVIGLVDAHAQIAATLERMRTDMLKEAERRALSVERLGAHVAHEVKNPLTALRGLVQLVARKTEDPRDRERLAVVIGEVDRALEVLKGYLGLARPLGDLVLAEVDLRALLTDVAGVLEARAHEREIRIEVMAQPQTVLADRQRLRDALLNLALNDIAAMSPGGALRLSTRALGEAVQIEVAHDGAGMSARMRARVGELLEQQRAAQRAPSSSSGLSHEVANHASEIHCGEGLFDALVGYAVEEGLGRWREGSARHEDDLVGLLGDVVREPFVELDSTHRGHHDVG
jgi:signal transduction histidine kinase